MKTIEESAFIRANKIGYSDLFAGGIKLGFIEGAKFVQQWIDVGEELPNIGNLVLLKFDDDYTQISTGIYNGSEFIDDFGFNEEKCTHWRPIEYK